MSDENPLLDFLLADLAWGKKPRDGRHPVVDDSRCPATHVTEAGDVEQCRYRLNHVGVTTDGWHDDAWGSGWLDAQIETADEAFAREIELAREVCEDAEVDALTQPVPTVTLPFGGDGGSRE